ncbi:cell division protein FtsL [Granulicatella adiacens ATCC 49175]|uniref:Cell division protein FtsL n=1 Tax=Granulicatella adiacens ATCC 49175 TaxID=638301 RepID=C8NFI7_9LACT|nr:MULTISPECIES: cell division protein FtsL [Granulicatella]MBF1211678.1 cell division protein FtsL [Granulicatella sp.]EEW37592.1 cell division protein FtsL [Granulicatella adiacens ATCC 49175]MCT2161338.1 cell division protein FtsL [Granulicatella adiacens]OFT02078.1 cell division protein FtsL [Granulicatella sp. HMSC31F03]OFT80680.1 cell division protein FtsL [Granulicatella sp. HMSC30F09]
MALAEKYVDTLNVSVPKQTPLVRKGQEVTSIPEEKQKANLMQVLILSGVVLAFLATMTIVASMIVANKNRQLQDIESQTTLIQRENNTLLQSTQELSQYDRVNRIANEQGLKMNEDNVRNVGR